MIVSQSLWYFQQLKYDSSALLNSLPLNNYIFNDSHLTILKIDDFLNKIFAYLLYILFLISFALIKRRVPSSLEATARKSFYWAWKPAEARFAELREFASGIVYVFPTTSRVEGDFHFWFIDEIKILLIQAGLP